MRAMGRAAVEALVGFIEGLDDAPALERTGAEELAARFREEAPEFGESFEKVLGQVVEAASKGIETAGPGFFGYIPGGGLYASALAALVGFGMNRFVNFWEAAPVFAQMEASVIRWMADLFEYPPEARGILTSGGSLANFSAIVTARHALLGERFLDGVMYTSDQAHHSVAKSAVLAGFPHGNLRLVPCTRDLRMDVTALHDMIDADRRRGLRPFCVVANGGTTNTGTVDPLVDLVGVAHERRMWVHVDAAYGGFFQLTERGRRALRGITGADSITLDPHKGLFLPYGTGALIVRDGARLRDAHRVRGEYMQDVAEETEIPSFGDYSPELSRDFRGLRVWLPLKLHGLHAFREALDEKLDLARWAYEELSSAPGFEVPWEPDLTVVPFRYAFRHRDVEDGNRKLLERVNATGRVFLSSTLIGGRFTLRMCILSHRSHGGRVEECVDIVKRLSADLDQ
jgi:aromatic-L-amino-acid decarboxylase